jgi:hypothetical protein
MSQAEYLTTTKFIEVARVILERQRPMTIRQLFYQMVGLADDTKREIGGFGNSQKDYRRVSRMMTKAREDKRVPWDWIVDRSRPTYEPQVWGDLAGYLHAVKNCYRKDYWLNQRVYCEVWCEKDAVIGSIEDLTSELGVIVRVGRGFQSSTRVREIASVFSRIRKSKIVFYLGDFDSSGMDIERDVRQRVCRYTRSFAMRRLAIFGEDIAKFKLPPQRIKPEDPRARSFRNMHGNQCVELDALPPPELRRHVRKAVTSVIDEAAWERALTTEEAELVSIDDFVSHWPLAGRQGGEAPQEPGQ